MTTLYLMFGIGALVAICWLAIEAGLLKKTPYEDCDHAHENARMDSVRGVLREDMAGVELRKRRHLRLVTAGKLRERERLLIGAGAAEIIEPPPPSDVTVGKYIRAVQQQARDAEQP